jgi:hypothetical protein
MQRNHVKGFSQGLDLPTQEEYNECDKCESMCR